MPEALRETSFAAVQQFALEIDDAIRNFEEGKRGSRRWAICLYLGATALSGLTTVLLGIKPAVPSPQTESWIHVAALSASALATLVAGWQAFFDSRWIWIAYAEASEELKLLRGDLQFARVTDSLTVASLSELRKEFNTILRATNRRWVEKRGHSVLREKLKQSDGQRSAGSEL